ncbi:unnamed protein product [Cochlearia groenlandica]
MVDTEEKKLRIRTGLLYQLCLVDTRQEECTGLLYRSPLVDTKKKKRIEYVVPVIWSIPFWLYRSHLIGTGCEK